MPDTMIARGRAASVPDTLPADEIRAVEARAEVDSLGDLHTRRRFLLNHLAPLAALYGNFGMWDARRKAMVSAAAIRIRLNAEEKLTEKVLDAAAHADPQYEQFLDEHYAAKVEYIKLDNELQEINERIDSRLAELHVYGKELSLAR